MILKNLIGTVVFIALMFTVSAFVYQEKKETPSKSTSTNNNGFAVLELFTSEGCSSCPPADRLMGEIEEKYKNQPVYILSYHVDYWNHLGWKDKFSSVENSKRQQQYAQTLHSQVYTPQLIVNGKKEFVGSDQDAVENSIKTALLNSNNAKIDLSAKVSEKEINVNFKTLESNSQNKLFITLVEKKSSTNVQSGENEGRNLIHWQIVHQQNQIALKNSTAGTTNFKLPENFNMNNWEIIGMIQNMKSGEILGSAKASF
ncbi:MAG: DUF1223 domain-containing protein [Chryseobacterium sp.]|uniref:DUF1223 domain-containing protein n=1 Tax=Chryseobacterium sp. TaxID=1871047 RepID=UPI000DB15F63|nr:DUF1223 domain-containing protein [Chryseobacterium sp.]MPS65415.1 DUF1223 domain-containing protein [Chryseobacterium sp.]PZU25277.1 MAG: DUF1223 domain-containing protein [Chryseobacterium sp.]